VRKRKKKRKRREKREKGEGEGGREREGTAQEQATRQRRRKFERACVGCIPSRRSNTIFSLQEASPPGLKKEKGRREEKRRGPGRTREELP